MSKEKIMSVMHMLNYLENRFIESSIKVKIQLYMLPLLSFLFVLYLINMNLVSKPQEVSSSKIKNIDKRKYSGSYLLLKKDIEDFCFKNKITVVRLSNKNKSILINAKSSIKKLMSFIYMLESINNFSNIKTFSLNKIKKTNIYEYSIEVTFNKYYIKQKRTEAKEKIKTKKMPIKVKAIIGGNVLINEKWINKNDSIGEYKLTSINKDFVELLYKNKTIKIKINKNEKFIK